MICLSLLILSIGVSQIHCLDPFESLFGFANLNESNDVHIKKRSIAAGDSSKKNVGSLTLPLPLQFIRPCNADTGLEPCFSSGSIHREGYQIDYYAGISAVMKITDFVKGANMKKQQYLNLPIPIEYIPKCDMKNGLKPCITVGEWRKDDMVVCYYMGVAKVSHCDSKIRNEASPGCTPETWWYCGGRNRQQSQRRSSLEGMLVDMIEKAPISDSKKIK